MGTLSIQKITWDTPHLKEVFRLYRASFPKEERVRLDDYLNDPVGNVDILGFYLDSAFEKETRLGDAYSVAGDDLSSATDGFVGFAGFAILMTYEDMTHILYFCIEEAIRGQGLGSMALQALREYYPENRIMADLEDPDPPKLPVMDVSGISLEGGKLASSPPFVPNRDERLRRVRFYERNGYVLSPVRYVWEGEAYVMLVTGGDLTMADFERYWDEANRDRGPGYERMDEEE